MHALRVVEGPEERRGAAELAGAFEAYHEAVRELKQLEPQVVALFESLRAAQDTLKGHGVRVVAEFEAPMQASLERWRATRPRPDAELPSFIESPRG